MQTILLTGATGGIGEALARTFSRNNYRLILCSEDGEKLSLLKEELGQEHHQYYKFDLTKKDEIDTFIADLTAGNEIVDYLINCAGVGFYEPFEELTFDKWKFAFDLNVHGTFYITQQLLPILQKTTNSWVITIGSGNGKFPVPGRVSYVATKFALRGWSLTLSREYKNKSPSFSHIALGSVMTEFGPKTLEEKQKMNKMGKQYFEPEEFASILFSIIQNKELQEEHEIYPAGYATQEEYGEFV